MEELFQNGDELWVPTTVTVTIGHVTRVIDLLKRQLQLCR